jgi:hypothetical protein
MFPMCWKCRDKIVIQRPNLPGPLATYKRYILIGCKANKNIHNYDDAKKYCPLIDLNPLPVTL